MKVYIAKHYWKDGENATWEVHSKIDKELFHYLKKNYHVFTKERPSMIEQSKHFIYLCYEDSSDAFGRSITSITFFVSARKSKLDFCQCSYNNLEYEVSSKNYKVLVLGTIVFMVLIYLIFPSKEPNVEVEKPISMVKQSTDVHSEEVIKKDSIKVKNIEKIEKVREDETRAKKALAEKEKEQEEKEVKAKDKFNKEMEERFEYPLHTLVNEQATDEEKRQEPVHYDYTGLINDWNKQVQYHMSTKDYLLNRDSNDKLVEQLNSWMRNFNIPEVSDSKAYNDFLENHKFGKKIYFETTMNEDEIRKKLKEVTKEKVVSSIVKKVLMMNDIDFWESFKKS